MCVDFVHASSYESVSARRSDSRGREERGVGRVCGRKRECFFTAVPRQINDGDARVGWISSCLHSYYTEDLESRRAMDNPRYARSRVYQDYHSLSLFLCIVINNFLFDQARESRLKNKLSRAEVGCDR